MKEMALTLAAAPAGQNAKLNVVREYLQSYLLRILQREKFFRTSAFIGGTALRFLYNLPRYSEDLDFSLTAKRTWKFADLLQGVKNELEQSGYQIAVTYKDDKTVLSAFVNFKTLLFEAGISPRREQHLSIKLEIDTRPPRGANVETAVRNKFFPLSLLTYDTPSLFAGKVHAILTRQFTKGRDYFDLAWYLSRWNDLSPNLVLLRNALQQTGWAGTLPDEKNWRDLLLQRARKTSWPTVERDVRNFLERPEDLQVFNHDNILRLLSADAGTD